VDFRRPAVPPAASVPPGPIGGIGAARRRRCLPPSTCRANARAIKAEVDADVERATGFEGGCRVNLSRGERWEESLRSRRKCGRCPTDRRAVRVAWMVVSHDQLTHLKLEGFVRQPRGAAGASRGPRHVAALSESGGLHPASPGIAVWDWRWPSAPTSPGARLAWEHSSARPGTDDWVQRKACVVAGRTR
jgi:hypothetical protein